MSESDLSSMSAEQSTSSGDAAHRDEIDRDDTDSALGSDDAVSDTTSLASTILHHREQWGRTYHKYKGGENDYWGPNDEQQNDALDIGHHMFTLLLDSHLYLAPLDSSKCRRVLDVGTGTGIWAIDFADAHPRIEVHGVDLSPTQPTLVPPNCTFAVDDVESEWTFPPDYFDFIHMRCLLGSIADWPALYKQAFKHLVPGGWIQALDINIRYHSDDGTVKAGGIMEQYSTLFLELGEKVGKTFDSTVHAARWISEAGFVDVHERWYKVPIGTWPREKKMKMLGMYSYWYSIEGCDGWSQFLLHKVLGWKMEEVLVYLAKLKQALKDPKIHSWFYVGVVYARKPPASLAKGDSH